MATPEAAKCIQVLYKFSYRIRKASGLFDFSIDIFLIMHYQMRLSLDVRRPVLF